VKNPFQYLVFDLDETLYLRRTGLMDEIGRRILLYMMTHLSLSSGQAAELRRQFNAQYGTVLRGLQVEYNVDADDYLRFVHHVPLENYLVPDPALDAMLSRIPLGKAIFTNADRAHAHRVTDCLGVAHHFPVVVDIRAVDFCCKPDLQAYHRLLDILGVPGEARILVEDSARNLRPARELFGMTTVILDGAIAEGVDYAIGDLLELEALVASCMTKSLS